MNFFIFFIGFFGIYKIFGYRLVYTFSVSKPFSLF